MEVMELLSSLLLTGGPIQASAGPHLSPAYACVLTLGQVAAVGANKDVCVSPNQAQSAESSPDGIQSRCKNNDQG